MILHQQLLQPATGPPEPWLAVHCESLTLAACSHAPGNNSHILIRLIAHSEVPVITSRSQPFAPPEIAHAISTDVSKLLPLARNRIQLPVCTRPERSLPEYLLLNTLQGTTPAIMHTADPVFIAFADPATAVLRAPEHFRSSVDLTPEGWAYWWEDAQRAFEQLSVEAASAAGIAVPDDID